MTLFTANIKTFLYKSSPNNFEQKNSQPTLFSLSDFENKKIEVQFTTQQMSSDSGFFFLKEVDKNISLICSTCYEQI